MSRFAFFRDETVSFTALGSMNDKKTKRFFLDLDQHWSTLSPKASFLCRATRVVWVTYPGGEYFRIKRRPPPPKMGRGRKKGEEEKPFPFLNGRREGGSENVEEEAFHHSPRLRRPFSPPRAASHPSSSDLETLSYQTIWCSSAAPFPHFFAAYFLGDSPCLDGYLVMTLRYSASIPRSQGASIHTAEDGDMAPMG